MEEVTHYYPPMNEEDEAMIKIIVDQDIEFYNEYMLRVHKELQNPECEEQREKMRLYCSLEFAYYALKEVRRAVYKEEQ